MRAWLVSLSYVLLGCSSSGSGTDGTPQPPKVSDYSTTCSVASDCVLIDTSSDACCGGCASAAIAKSDQERYQSDRNRFRSTCNSLAPCPAMRCELRVATCEGGTCKAAACSPTCPGADAGADAPTDGATDGGSTDSGTDTDASADAPSG